MNMIVLLFLFGCVYAVLHFLWESIAAPEIRLIRKFDLFALRDKLRRLKRDHPEMTDEAYRTVEEGVNGGVRILYGLDIPLLLHFRTLVARDEAMRDRIAKRRAIVDADPMAEELHAVMASVGKLLEQTAVVNSGGIMLYVIPIALVCMCFKKIFGPVISLLYISDYEMAKMMPVGCPQGEFARA